MAKKEDEKKEETVEETKDEAVEETKDEQVEAAAEEVVEEKAEEATEEKAEEAPAEPAVEEKAEEATEEKAEEAPAEPAAEEKAEEAPAKEEKAEEPAPAKEEKAKPKAAKKSGGSSLSSEDIIEAVKSMTVLELSELVTELQDTFGVVAAAPVAAGPAAGGDAAGAEEEKTIFDVILTAVGDKKIQVIKVVRSLTSLGLKEAKDVVDGAPRAVKEGVSKDEAEAAKKDLEEAGASVEVK